MNDPVYCHHYTHTAESHRRDDYCRGNGEDCDCKRSPEVVYWQEVIYLRYLIEKLRRGELV